MEDLKKIISDVFKAEFDTAELVSVSVEPDFDQDGDEVIQLRFVFHTEDGRLDARKVKSLVRHLREPMQKLGENRFPILRFITQEEFENEAA